MVFLRAVMVAAVLARLGVANAADSTLPFEVENARGGTGLALSADAAPSGDTVWKRTIRLAVVGDARQTTDGLAIDPIPVETERGESATVSATVAKQDAMPGQRVVVELTGTFKVPGVYKGELWLEQAGHHRVVPLQITICVPSGKRALPLGLHGGSAILLTESWTGDADDDFALYVQNTGAGPISVAPTVLGIAQLDKADAPAIRRTVDAQVTAGKPVPLDDATPRALSVSLAGIDGPGIYEVETELRDPTGTYQPIQVKTIVFRKHSWVIAALWIAVGAVIAFAARLYIDGGGDRLKLRREIALLLQQIAIARGHARSDPVLAAARALEIDVEDRQRYVRWGGTVADIQREIQRAEQRLALLCDVIEAGNQLERLDPARQSAVRKALDDALLLVRIDSCDDARLAAKRTEIAQLGLTATWRDQLASDLAALESQVNGHMSDRGAFGAKLRDISADLAKIHALLASDQLDAAHAALDEARSKLLDSSAGELAAVVTGAPPPGVDDGTWVQTASELKPALDEARNATRTWAQRWAAFRTAQNRYVTTAINGLIGQAKKLASDKNLGARMTEIVAKLEAALKDPSSATALYDSLRREVEAARPVAKGVAAAATAAPPTVWQPITFGAGEPKPDVAAAREVVRLDREVRSTSVLVNIAVLVVGVATGVKTLWLDDPCWGAHGAALTAFLWGAGVQVAGNAFAGLAALRTKLGAIAGN